MASLSEPTEPDSHARALALRIWSSLLATQEMMTVYLGVRLGVYDLLAGSGPLTAGEIADRAGLDPRYAREWLEQQATAGLLVATTAPGGERFALAPGAGVVLTVSDHPLSMSALAALPIGGVAAALPALLSAYRTGAGVPDATYGPDWLEGHSGANRAVFAHQLPGWIARLLPDVHATLQRPGSRIADVACGAGWSSIALARAYPQACVDGFDLDQGAVERAGANVAAAGLQERVRIEVRDAADPAAAGTYDLVCLFDALHEMGRPRDVLAACRGLRARAGTVLVMDARVQPRFTAPGDEIERFQYATSVLHCLPVARDGEGPGGTGTVLRPDAMRALAAAAGFAATSVVEVDDRFHRMYRLIG